MMNSKKFCALCGTRVMFVVAFLEKKKTIPRTQRATTTELVMKLKTSAPNISDALALTASTGEKEREVKGNAILGWVGKFAKGFLAGGRGEARFICEIFHKVIRALILKASSVFDLFLLVRLH